MIQEKLHEKWLEWASDPDNDPPNHIVLPISDFNDFEKYLMELERNESMPLTWLRNVHVISSEWLNEIKIGRLV